MWGRFSNFNAGIGEINYNNKSLCVFTWILISSHSHTHPPTHLDPSYHYCRCLFAASIVRAYVEQEKNYDLILFGVSGDANAILLTALMGSELLLISTSFAQ